MKRLVCIVFLTAILRLPCGGAGDAVPVPGKEVAVTARAGRQLTVTLPANPTTGYDWELLPGYDGTVLSFTGRRIARDAARGGLSGAPVSEQWSFKANKSGTATFRLVYKRSWEPECISTMTYTVTVK